MIDIGRGYTITADERNVILNYTYLTKAVEKLGHKGGTEKTDTIGFFKTVGQACDYAIKVAIRNGIEKDEIQSLFDYVKEVKALESEISSKVSEWSYLHKTLNAKRSDTKKQQTSEAWKGVRIIGVGNYALLKCPDHPRANTSGYVPEHVIVMESYLGRYLYYKTGDLNSEIVHHIDADRQNNSIKNLQLMKAKDHIAVHAGLTRAGYNKEMSLRKTDTQSAPVAENTTNDGHCTPDE
jgi:hypothetical protein